MSDWWYGFFFGVAVAFLIATCVVEWLRKHGGL